jgi:alpha-glucoside transport system permease protein
VLYLLPAALLVGVVLVLPLVWAVVDSLHGGLGNYAGVLRDGQVRHAVRNSLFWLVLAPVICLFGLLLAWTIRAHRWIGVLAAPIAVSALVTGLAFRLIAQPGDFLLGRTGIWLLLGLAFAWQWSGLAVVVFRSGLNAIPPGLVRMAQAFGVSRARRLRTVIGPALFPAGALVLIIVLVAAARVFDLILIAAPGSDQAEVDVVGLHWWRFRDDLGPGESAALTVIQFAIAAVAALIGLWGLSREWPTNTADAEPGAGPRRRRRGRVVAVLAAVVWVLPLSVLLVTSLHTPRAAAGGVPERPADRRAGQHGRALGLRGGAAPGRGGARRVRAGLGRSAAACEPRADHGHHDGGRGPAADRHRRAGPGVRPAPPAGRADRVDDRARRLRRAAGDAAAARCVRLGAA